MTKSAYFIGGPADGTLMALPVGRRRYSVAVREEPMSFIRLMNEPLPPPWPLGHIVEYIETNSPTIWIEQGVEQGSELLSIFEPE